MARRIIKITKGGAGDYHLIWEPWDHELPTLAISLPLSPEELQEIEEELVVALIEEAADRFGAGYTPGDATEFREQAAQHGRKLYQVLQATGALEALDEPAGLAFRCPSDWDVMPWELLHDGQNFLAFDRVIVRLADAELPEEKQRLLQEPFPLPLHILGLSYSPRGADVGADRHWAEVEKALRANPGETCFRVLNDEERRELLKNGRLPDDVRRVDILHILAHGAGPDEGDGLINLGQEYTPGDLVRQLLPNEKFDALRLVILASCESGRMLPGRPLSTVSEGLLQAGIPAVIAMQYKVSPLAATLFVSGLYQGLLDRQPLGQAVLQGRRRADQIRDSVEWATPVLYTAADDLTLFAPLSPADRRYRAAYLGQLRALTPALSDAEYLPLQASPVISVLEKPADLGDATTGSQSPGKTFVHTATDGQSQSVDARDVLLGADHRLARPVTVLLGEAGSGKTTVVDKLIGQLLAPPVGVELADHDQVLAADPAAPVPIRLSLNLVGVEASSYRLETLVHQAMADAVARAQERLESPPAEGPPSLAEAGRWTENNAWRFFLILEGMEEVAPEKRREGSKHIRNLIQANPHHTYLLSATPGTFGDYAPHLGQYPQWQIVPLTEEVVKQQVEDLGLHPLLKNRGLVGLLRQPWALITLQTMHRRGVIFFDQASLLSGRIDQLLSDEKLPTLGRQRLARRIRLVLAQLALEMERGNAGNRANPSLPVDDFFALMKRVRGERTYDLEALFQELLDAELLEVDLGGEIEVIRFPNPYVQAILSALALDQALQEDQSILDDFDLLDARLGTALTLLAQLHDRNVPLILAALIERLDELANQWLSRLEVLDLAVRVIQRKPQLAGPDMKRRLIWELGRCLAREEDEDHLWIWLTTEPAGPLVNVSLDNLDQPGRRLPRTSMRIRVVELLGLLDDSRVFELLRWFIMEPSRPGQECLEMEKYAHSGLRQAAAHALRDHWQSFASDTH
ncbi:MAG: CHAT domain-containing protein, partial [Chloroflexi bacterium]|nr:CHAT domain-containing protein [Chloroflexota bacterium]